jgi:hypothetical protein
MSTPNRLFSSPGKAFDEKPNNPYHTQEFDQTFFLNLLGDRFETVELYGQDWKEIPENNTDTRSTLMNKMKLPILKAKFHAQNLIIYEKRAEVTKAAKDGQQPVYFVAICKNPRK